MVTAWFLVGTIKLEPNHHDKRKNVVRDYGIIKNIADLCSQFLEQTEFLE